MDIRLTHDPELPPGTVRVPLGLDREIQQAIVESQFTVVPAERIGNGVIGVSSDIASRLEAWEQRFRESN